MSGPLRSKQGCWTCRLRKKKCDEGRPHCSTCESLSITCYGFGLQKPDWMDNGEKERAVANNLKQIVKHTSRRKGTTQFSKQRGQVSRIAPKPSNDSVESSSSDPGSNHQHVVAHPPDYGSAQEDGVNVRQDGSSETLSPENDDHLMAGCIFSMAADESVLLMHFLDIVFPLQFPMYKPGTIEGGRGWLLALLLRTKPLYHAALALSAFHRRTTIFEKIPHQCQVAALVQQEKHLEICLTEFRQSMKTVNQFVRRTCPKNGLGIAISIVQLVFFELFAGQSGVWKIHLRAATNMYHRRCRNELGDLSLTEKSLTILNEDLPLFEDGPVVTQEVVIFRFLSGTTVWLDIISSITAGSAPHLLPYHSAIASNSQTRLEDIMGCKNWVMVQIGRIAALHERKIQALQQGNFNCTEFQQTVVDISKEIQCGRTQGALEGFNISERDPTTIISTISDPPMLITRIFADMASFYLHLVIQGFQTLELLDTTISEAMSMLQTQIPVHLLPALVAPLYIIGSVARQEDEQFFRNIFSSPPLLDPLFGHRGRILPSLEEIWSKRKATSDLTWKDSLELTHDLLLI